MNVAAWSHDPERNDDDKHAENVQHEHDCLSQRQPDCEEDVEKETEDDDADGKERLVPGLYLIGSMVQFCESNDQTGLCRCVSLWL